MPAAIIHPALVARKLRGGTQLVGPLGVGILAEDHDGDIPLELIAASGGLIPGSSQAVMAVDELLADPNWSRTISYFLCTCSTVDAVLCLVEKIKSLSLLIVGCGGIGSLSAVLCGGLNVHSMTLVDGDRIELSNLNRQLFWRPQDSGRYKVDVLKREIGVRYPAVKVSAHREQWPIARIGQAAAEFGAILYCADEPLGAQSQLATACADTDCVILSAGYSFSRSYVTLHSGNKPVIDEDGEIWRNVSEVSIAPSYGPMNAQLAGRLVMSLVEALTDKSR